MKITFVLTVHLPNDERVWYQQAESLKRRGHEVSIISSKVEGSNLSNVFCFNDIGLSKKNVIQKIITILSNINPEIIICDNPISVIAAKKHISSTQSKATLIYDVTEWYPSTLNLKEGNFLNKSIKFFTLSFLSFYAGCLVNKFIFGEYYKGIFFRILFPFKKFIYLSYYANDEFINKYPVKDISNRCELFYSGNLTNVNGFDKVLKVTQECAKKMPNTTFVLKIISPQKFENDSICDVENIEFQYIHQLPFFDFCKEIGKSDIFLDIRKIDCIKNHSLPIKIFYYMAAGRPVIYSDLKAIRKFFPKNIIPNFAHLVNPKKIDHIVNIIEKYINNPEYYNKSCNFAYEMAQSTYNWKMIEMVFIHFIEKND